MKVAKGTSDVGEVLSRGAGGRGAAAWVRFERMERQGDGYKMYFNLFIKAELCWKFCSKALLTAK